MLTEAPFSFKGLVMSRKVRPHIACYDDSGYIDRLYR